LAYESEALMSVIAAAEAVSSDVRDVQRKSENYWLHVFIKENMLGQEYEATVINKSPGGYFVEISEIVTKTKLMTQEKLDSGDKITVLIEKVKASKGFIQLALCKS
jgi:exoribonuclease-2